MFIRKTPRIREKRVKIKEHYQNNTGLFLKLCANNEQNQPRRYGWLTTNTNCWTSAKSSGFLFLENLWNHSVVETDKFQDWRFECLACIQILSVEVPRKMNKTLNKSQLSMRTYNKTLLRPFTEVGNNLEISWSKLVIYYSTVFLFCFFFATIVAALWNFWKRCILWKIISQPSWQRSVITKQIVC